MRNFTCKFFLKSPESFGSSGNENRQKTRPAGIANPTQSQRPGEKKVKVHWNHLPVNSEAGGPVARYNLTEIRATFRPWPLISRPAV